jgi:DNA-directed RNA polymerase specialized sigma24 family protein
MSSEGSVTLWLGELKKGNTDAAQPLWDRYFADLVRLARSRLGKAALRVEDEEDVAIAAMNSFYRGAVEGRFPQLNDRDNLWPLLVVLTARKASNAVRQEHAGKRGGGKVKGESVWLCNGGQVDVDLGIEQVMGNEPTPAFAAEVADNVARLLEVLEFLYLREVAVLKMEGYTNAEIASKQGVVERTIERRLDLIRKHLGRMLPAPAG